MHTFLGGGGSRARAALLVVALTTSPAWAQAAISGTLNASFVGFNEFGVPSLKVDLALQCSLTCTSSAPELHYSVVAGVYGRYASDPDASAGSLGAFFGSDPSGNNTATSTAFPTGSAFIMHAKSATCWCGNANGQGGYVNLTTPVVTIPPRVSLDATGRVGSQSYVTVTARPWNTDTVEVTLSGAGLNETRVLDAAAFGTSRSNGIEGFPVTPTQPGTLTVTAKLQPYGVVSEAVSMTINASGSTGGGSGSSGTGGGSSSGGGTGAEPGGCTTAPGLLSLGLLGLLLRRRR